MLMVKVYTVCAVVACVTRAIFSRTGRAGGIEEARALGSSKMRSWVVTVFVGVEMATQQAKT